MMADVQETVIISYLNAMERGDLDTVCSCFTAGATISSPVYGDVGVRPFYERLFADTLSVDVAIQQIYRAPDDADRWAAHFAYKWRRSSGSTVDTDLVDLFEFEGEKIARLHIVFDSRPKS